MTKGYAGAVADDELDLIGPNETAYRLELTAAQLKITHTALRSLLDDFGHEEHDVKDIVLQVLAKLPDEHDIRAIDLDREIRRAKGELRPGSEAEGELRVLAHLVRRPRRREDHRARSTCSTPSSSPTNSSHLLGDLRTDRARRRGQRERDVDVAAVDLDPVDEPELDEVQAELRVDDVREGVLDVFHGRHGA